MKTDNGTILRNQRIAHDIYAMQIQTNIAREVNPGQFVQFQVPGFFLRRPISICDVNGQVLTLVYRIAGAGTKRMSQMKTGETVNLFGPLGNGFPIKKREVLMIGGGIGVPPLLLTAKAYRNAGQTVHAVLGFNTAEDIILADSFRKAGCDVHIACMDGSSGIRGTVLDAVRTDDIRTPFVLACGPLPMLKAVSGQYREGFISVESRMACGMGACMGCVILDAEGNSLRVCKEGPVFPIGKVVL